MFTGQVIATPRATLGNQHFHLQEKKTKPGQYNPIRKKKRKKQGKIRQDFLLHFHREKVNQVKHKLLSY